MAGAGVLAPHGARMGQAERLSPARRPGPPDHAGRDRSGAARREPPALRPGHRRADPLATGLQARRAAPYDRALLERELALFPEWYIGAPPRHRRRRQAEGAARSQLQADRRQQPRFARRLRAPRLHAAQPDDRQRQQRSACSTSRTPCYGPVTYDIASLMRDAFLSWDEEFVLDITIRYWTAARKAGLPVDEDFGAFYRAVEWMGLQRHLKVAGIFARLTLRDGKPQVPGRHAALHCLHPRHRQPLHGADAAAARDRRNRGHFGHHAASPTAVSEGKLKKHHPVTAVQRSLAAIDFLACRVFTVPCR